MRTACTAAILLAGVLTLPALAAPPGETAPAAVPPQAAPPAPCTAPSFHQLDFWLELGPHLARPGADSGRHRHQPRREDPGRLRDPGELRRQRPAAARRAQRLGVRPAGTGLETDLGRQPGGLHRADRRLPGRRDDPHPESPRPGWQAAPRRMVFLNIKPDSFDWRWESSSDGKTWEAQLADPLPAEGDGREVSRQGRRSPQGSATALSRTCCYRRGAGAPSPRAVESHPRLSQPGWRHQMKKLALTIAFVLLATVSASAAEISQAAPVVPAAVATPASDLAPLAGTPAPLFMGPHPPVPRCSALDGDHLSDRRIHHGLHRRLQ